MSHLCTYPNEYYPSLSCYCLCYVLFLLLLLLLFSFWFLILLPLLFILFSLLSGIPFINFHCPSFLFLLSSSLFTSCLSLGSCFFFLFLCVLVSSLHCSSSTLSTSHILTFSCSSSFSVPTSSSRLPLPLCSFHYVLLQHAPPQKNKNQQNTILIFWKTGPGLANFTKMPFHGKL